MPQVKSVEAKIRSFEGFEVKFVTPEGSDVRSDKMLQARFDGYVNRAASTMTVAAWKQTRFKSQFPGYDAQVLLGDGTHAHGGTQLKTVRASYK